MDISLLTAWMEANALQASLAIFILSLLALLVARFMLARGIIYLSKRSENRFDDVIVHNLHPMRISIFAPLVVLYIFAYTLPDFQAIIQNITVVLALWLAVITINSLMDAFNEIYESRETFNGVTIQGYLDLVKLLFIVLTLILSVSVITNTEPYLLLSGLGALTAVLLLVFRDTLLSVVASVQISTNDLVKQGDWLEVPEFHADGDVTDMTLHSVVIQNWDKTISVVPTSKLLDTPYKNWRGMSESGGRRIKRSLSIDLTSVAFLGQEDIKKLKRISIVRDYLEQKESELRDHNAKLGIDDSVLVNGRRLTNIGTFRAYVEAYLRQNPDIHQEKMTLMVRQLASGPKGLPIEVYAFTKTTAWLDYENAQAYMFDHLLAAVPQFGLRLFQEPSGHDFAKLKSK
ncbi:MAG: mechanosensitive ion channel family protein [Chloroflexota bacterium]